MFSEILKRRKRGPEKNYENLAFRGPQRVFGGPGGVAEVFRSVGGAWGVRRAGLLLSSGFGVPGVLVCWGLGRFWCRFGLRVRPPPPPALSALGRVSRCGRRWLAPVCVSFGTMFWPMVAGGGADLGPNLLLKLGQDLR